MSVVSAVASLMLLRSATGPTMGGHDAICHMLENRLKPLVTSVR